MKMSLKQLPFAAIAWFLSAGPVLANAGDEVRAGLTATKDEAGYGAIELPKLIGQLISALLGTVGIIFLILTVYAGILYMTAAGEAPKVEKAKKILTYSLIGLIIIVGAYALTNFVIAQLLTATGTVAGTPAPR